jgi:hypothetical protein
MSKLSKITKIFAAAGIAFNGVLTPDAIALAKAIEVGSPLSIESFISSHSQSEYVGEAIIYLAEKGGKGKGGSKGNTGGGSKGGKGGKGGGKGGKSSSSGGGGGADTSDNGGSSRGGGFKSPGEKGRPAIFGPPGPPAIGAPGQYKD